MNTTKFFCPDCGREFKQGEYEYNYEYGTLEFECPLCGWIGTDSNVDMNYDENI